MIFPTVTLAIYITYINRKDRAELAHNLAVCFWILANSTWMIGEFYFEDSIRPLAIVFFCAGLIMMARYYFTAVYQIAFNRKNKSV